MLNKGKKMKEIKFLFITVIICVLASCASIQKDLSVSPEETFGGENILELESALIILDGKSYGSDAVNVFSEEEKKELASLIDEIDKNLSNPIIEKSVEARLLAMKGRCFLLLENKSEAKKFYLSAQKKFENDVQCIVLGRRLGEVTVNTSSRYKADACLIIEAALEMYDEGKFEIACGLFDEAFLKSNNFYRDAYQELRDISWDLKGLEEGSNVAFWTKKSLTVTQMMELTQDSTRLLDYYTGTKYVHPRQLYRQLMKAGLMESLSKDSNSEDYVSTVLKENTVVTRILAARYLWNLYVTNKALDGTKYSARYRKRTNPKSPVADVDISSEDFDAVLGVIENEIMSLVDGKNFYPDENISPAQMRDALTRIE